MKILFVNYFGYQDYLNDMVYHGLIDNGFEVYETAYPSYMLKTHPDPLSLYGRGFSVFAKLDHSPRVETPESVSDRISSRFYDAVVFGSVHRDLSYLEQVKQAYPKSAVHFIDGEDHTEIIEALLSYGNYWKRECIDERVRPITFSIPESQLISVPLEKTQLFGQIIPNDTKTYVFDNEADYYRDYAVSYYGITRKKAGWDCMRHYEILANRCAPYFQGLEDCPKLTLFNFPKQLVLELSRFAAKQQVHPFYDELTDQLFEYTRQNLTTKQISRKLFE